MKSALIIFPGSNCDRDVSVALDSIFQSKPIRVWHKENHIPNVNLIVIPGGFSFGDYLRPGSIARHSSAMYSVIEHAKKGVPILGICNGFQILTESGLLPGTLIKNSNLQFICKKTYLHVENTDSIFTKNYTRKKTVQIPIAHHDGNYFANEETIKKLENENRIAFKYCDSDGKISKESNPNGSINNIAGILNNNRKVLGMMPHPERAVEGILGSSDGHILFSSILENINI